MTKQYGRTVLFVGIAALSATASLAEVKTAPKPAEAAASEARSKEAEAAFELNCSGCHDISEATSKRKDLAGWAATVEKMISYGAPVAAEDQALIVSYLAATYPSGKQ